MSVDGSPNVDDIDVQEPEATYYEDAIRLPGFGSPPDRCRELEPAGFCRECGEPLLGRSSCRTRYCPDHWRDWLESSLISFVARLAAYRYTQDGADRRLLHAVASPPQDRRYSAREFWSTRSDSYDELEAAGARGGVCVAHAYRTSDDLDHLYDMASEHGDVDDQGRWSVARETAEDWDDMKDFVDPAPHYHALVPARDFDGSKSAEGWTVHNIRSLSRFHYKDPESYRDMARVGYYVLTHGAAQDGRATTTYFGEVHPATFDPAEELPDDVWSEIQRRAEHAVTDDQEKFVQPGSDNPELLEDYSCHDDECEGDIIDIRFLEDYLDNEDWLSSIRCQPDGRKKIAQLRGLCLWHVGLTDCPPPRARVDRDRLLRWCVHKDASHYSTPDRDMSQSGLSRFA